MSLWDTIKGWFSRRRREPLVSRQDAMRVYPVRNENLEWKTTDDGLAVLTVEARADTYGRLLASVLDSPNEKKIELDELGTWVWTRCDGEHTIQDLVTEMAADRKLSRREVELSLTEFLRTLARRGMIGVAVPEEIMEKLDPEALRSLGVTETEVKEGRSIIPPAGSSSSSDQEPSSD